MWCHIIAVSLLCCRLAVIVNKSALSLCRRYLVALSCDTSPSLYPISCCCPLLDCSGTALQRNTIWYLFVLLLIFPPANALLRAACLPLLLLFLHTCTWVQFLIKQGINRSKLYGGREEGGVDMHACMPMQEERSSPFIFFLLSSRFLLPHVVHCWVLVVLVLFWFGLRPVVVQLYSTFFCLIKVGSFSLFIG